MNDVSNRRVAHIAFSGLAAMSVSACSGGGGGGPTTGAVTPPAAPAAPASPLFPSETSSEYNANWAIADVKAVSAWRQGATGSGVTVAVIDDGVDAANVELSGGVVAASKDMDSARNQLFSPAETHGSEVASLIAGRFNNASTVGVAFNSKILALRADDGSGNFSSTVLANAIDTARLNGARTINLSLGAAGPLGAAFEAALTRATQAGIIVVASAGNGGVGAANPDYPALYATDPSISNGLVIVSGAHDKTGQIASFSSRAGGAQNFYVTAPGSQIIVPDFGAVGPTDPAFQVCFANGTCQVQGTSYSAPLTAGAVALLLNAFPGLSAQQVVNLLLSNTDDIGAAGVDAVAGRGRIDLAKAFAPTGAVSAPLSSGGAVSPSDGPIGMTGASFGDSLQRSAAFLDLVGFDQIGRPYSFNLASQFRRAERPAAKAAPRLWNDAALAGSASVAFALTDRSKPQSLREPFQRDDADPQSTPFLARFRLNDAMEAVIASGTDAAPDIASDALSGHLDFVGADLSAQISRRWRGGKASFISQVSRADLGQGFGYAERSASALRLQDRLTAPSALGERRIDWSLTLGTFEDRGSLLGTTWSPRFGGGAAAEARFAGAGVRLHLSDSLSLSARGEWSWMHNRSAGSAFSAGDLQSSAFGLSAQYSLMPLPGFWPDAVMAGRSALTFSVSQPLRLENGALIATLPDADAYGRSTLRYVTRSIPLHPSGRELDLRWALDFQLRDTLIGRAEFSQIFEPGHVKAAPPETMANIGVRWAF